MTADDKPSADTFRQKEYVAIGYIVDARSYLDAARLIESVEEHQPALSSPIYFLLCHAIELVLKAYILASGGTEAKLRQQKIRHNLDGLRNLAVSLGYSPSKKIDAVIDLLAPHHANHSFRYRNPGYKSYPLIDEAIKSLETMLAQIHPVVARNLMAHIAAGRPQ
jgi:hypothetical protein